MSDTSSKSTVWILTSIAAVAAAYICWDFYSSKDKPEENPKEQTSIPEDPQPIELKLNPMPLPDSNLPDATPEEEAADLGMTMEFSDPEGLVEKLTEQLKQVKTEDDLQKLALILGNGKVNPEHLKVLQTLFAENRLKLDDMVATQLIGELKAGKRSRWAINLADGSNFQLDIERQKDGKWKVDEVLLPLPKMGADGKPLSPAEIAELKQARELKDSMNYTHQFMKVLTSLNFEKARDMVNSEKISDAKIAGLCILFEDGNYVIDEKKPLQAIRLRDDISAFYANVVSKDPVIKQGAQFSITAVRASKDKPWIIDEINLDRLLEDYAKRVAGGDVYYTPLIDNPDGGDTLVIYFDFDSEGLTKRTEKQLEIVARLLKLDKRKKVTLSGHTDAKGGDGYNKTLSEKRATAVKAYLKKAGIDDSQIVTKAFGFTKPRRPDFKEDGSDDPNARRANRRTEIYLDF